MSSEQNHFFAGSACLSKERNSLYPKGVAAVSDILAIKTDLEDQIPNGSWMIYILELFLDKDYIQSNHDRGVPLELDLFCEVHDTLHSCV